MTPRLLYLLNRAIPNSVQLIMSRRCKSSSKSHRLTYGLLLSMCAKNVSKSVYSLLFGFLQLTPHELSRKIRQKRSKSVDMPFPCHLITR